MGGNTRKFILEEIPGPCKIRLNYLTPALESRSEQEVLSSKVLSNLVQVKGNGPGMRRLGLE